MIKLSFDGGAMKIFEILISCFAGRNFHQFQIFPEKNFRDLSSLFQKMLIGFQSLLSIVQLRIFFATLHLKMIEKMGMS